MKLKYLFLVIIPQMNNCFISPQTTIFIDQTRKPYTMSIVNCGIITRLISKAYGTCNNLR